MANVSRPSGFIPVMNAASGDVAAMNEYVVTTGQTIYPGDAVTLVAAGTVSVAAAAGTVVGVSADYIDDSLSAGGKKCLVYDDPNTIFSVESDDTTPITDIGTLGDIVATTGDTIFHKSKQVLDGSTATGATGVQAKIVGLDSRVGNDWGLNARVRVRFAKHSYGGAITTAV